jgi:hypothetical protein
MTKKLATSLPCSVRRSDQENQILYRGLAMSPTAQEVSQDVFTWLGNTYYSPSGPRPADPEYAFAKFSLDLLESRGWSGEAMAYVIRSYELLQRRKQAGHPDAAQQALAELKDSLRFRLKADKEGKCSMHG